MKKYSQIVRLDTDYKPIDDIDVLDTLPAGVYELQMNQAGEIFFAGIKSIHDALVDLPNTEYDLVLQEIEMFMKPSTRKLFEENGFLYKRSSLLYGPPGSGKTSLVNRITQKVVLEGGIVLFSPNPKMLEEAFKILDSLQPETRVMVIFEELDQLIKSYESELLNILDGEIQKNNVIFMATTNYISQIPSRIRRPGRFSSVIEVGFPTKQTRLFYLRYKLKHLDGIDIDSWAQKTVGFSIDELKETVLAVVCLGQNLDDIVQRIITNKKGKDYAEESQEIDPFDEDDENEKDRSVDWGLSTKKKKSIFRR